MSLPRIAYVLASLACAACTAKAPPKLPPSGTTVASLLATLDAAADRACACTDRYCTEEVERELDDAVGEHPDHPRALTADASFERIDASIQRGLRCLWKQRTLGTAYGPIAIEVASSARDAMCACKDVGCVHAAIDAATRAERLEAVPTPDDVKAVMQPIEEARATCYDRAVSKAGQEEIDALTDLAQRACACSDEACKSGIESELAGLQDRFATLLMSRDQTTTAYGLIGQMAQCLRGKS